MRALLKASILILSIFSVSCIENKTSEASLKDLSANISTQAIGVGVSEDIALMDSYSSYYALKQGVHFIFADGKVKLNMDFANVPIDTLNGSKVTRPWNGFVIYEYPYTGSLSIRSANIQKLSASVKLTKPFSFLSRMLAKALLDHYANEKEKKTGTLYFTSMSYRINEGESAEIHAEILLAEDAKPDNASGGK